MTHSEGNIKTNTCGFFTSPSFHLGNLWTFFICVHLRVSA